MGERGSSSCFEDIILQSTNIGSFTPARYSIVFVSSWVCLLAEIELCVAHFSTKYSSILILLQYKDQCLCIAKLYIQMNMYSSRGMRAQGQSETSALGANVGFSLVTCSKALGGGWCHQRCKGLQLRVHPSVTDRDQTSYPSATGWQVIFSAFQPRESSSPLVGSNKLCFIDLLYLTILSISGSGKWLCSTRGPTSALSQLSKLGRTCQLPRERSCLDYDLNPGPSCCAMTVLTNSHCANNRNTS